MNMKKAMILASLAMMSAGAMAATSGGSATAASSYQVAPSDCGALKEAVTLQTSAGVFSAVNCNTTSNVIGVAAASSKGAKKVFSTSSNGGSITEGTLSALPSSASDITSYAQTASGSTGGTAGTSGTTTP